MSIQDYFKRNPFQNLVVATKKSSSLNLHGHVEPFTEVLERIASAVQKHDYSPEDSQHTIVFGEWGHGKTHFLRSLEQRINSEWVADAKALFYEPTVTASSEILKELCYELGIDTCSTPEKFISSLKEGSFPPNLFLLIDETQSLVGENMHSIHESDLNDYYKFLEELMQVSQLFKFNLHIFHGFSANSANAIARMSKLDLVDQLKKNVFTLNSLDEESQWKMIVDHIEDQIKEGQNIKAEDLLERGVNRCINHLVGGNPRWALQLMHAIYEQSKTQNMMDSQACYLALQETARIDIPTQKYFDPLIINQAIDSLKVGRVFEKKLSKLIDQDRHSIFGAWEPLNLDSAKRFDLTSKDLRKACPSLKEISIFEQNRDANATFSITEEFQRKIQVHGPKNIFKHDERNLLLSLSLTPERSLRKLIAGFNFMLKSHNYATRRETSFGHPMIEVLFFRTGIIGNSIAKVEVGLIIYKGDEIPREVFDRIVKSLEDNQCSIFVIIEDANTMHDNPASSYNKFKNEYSGKLNLENRFIFINKVSGTTNFDESFFVKTIEIHKKDEFEQREHFKLFELEKLLDSQTESVIYCPDEKERALVNKIINIKEGIFTVQQIKDLDPEFHWISKEKLSTLLTYIDKRGAKYTHIPVKTILPFKSLLKILKGSDGLSKELLGVEYRKKWILTGQGESRERYINWILDIFKNTGDISKEGDIFQYRDIKVEITEVKERIDTLRRNIKVNLDKCKNASIAESSYIDNETRLGEIRESLEEENQSQVDELSELKGLENELKEIDSSFKELLVRERKLLKESFKTVFDIFESLLQQKPTWPITDSSDPLDEQFKEYHKEVKNLKVKLNNENSELVFLKESLDDLEENSKICKELLEKPESSISENEPKERAAFKIYSAIRNGLEGEIKVEYQTSIQD